MENIAHKKLFNSFSIKNSFIGLSAKNTFKTKYRTKSMKKTEAVDMLLRGVLNSASLDLDEAVSHFTAKKKAYFETKIFQNLGIARKIQKEGTSVNFYDSAMKKEKSCRC